MSPQTSSTRLSCKHLMQIADLSADDLMLVLDTADSLQEVLKRPIKKVPTLSGKTVVLLFFEPSTRTRTSFEIASKRLSADTLEFDVKSSSTTKGETLLDTAKNIEAMQPDALVVRHGNSGVPQLLSKHLNIPIVNAGDGMHEHPTQALLDLYTIRAKKGRIEGLEVAIVGDIAHSRVARSNIHALNKLGAKVRLAGPATMVPKAFEQMGTTVYHRVEEAIEGVDVVMMLRIQRERQGSLYFPSLGEYAKFYGLTSERVALAKPDAIVMHPGPVNQGVEIMPSVLRLERSVVLDQVANGVVVRMAVLYLLIAAAAKGSNHA